MKILLLKFRNIGDVLLSTPLINNLRHHYPNSKIDFCVNKDTQAMLTLNTNLNKIITYDRSSTKSLTIIKRLWRELRFIQSFKKENYDIVINLTNGDRGNLIAWVSNAPVRIGYSDKNWFFRKSLTHELPKQELRHTVDTSLDPLRALNIPISNKLVEIFWSSDDEKFISKELENIGNFIHIHPVSRWLFKCISDNIMAQIIDYCELKLGFKVVITASEDNFELEKVNKILSLARSKPINLSGRLSLKQTAALNKRAALFIGVDTSIMHISASNNVPVLAFFGPSGACHWGPWDNSLMISGYNKVKGFQVMGMHRVFSESRVCQPCGKDGCNGSKISDCLMYLDFEKIKRNILEMLNE
jgi:heptosyltransferase III